MRKKKRKQRTWQEIFQSERKTFPPGCCVTKVIPDKRRKQPKHKQKGDMEDGY